MTILLDTNILLRALDVQSAAHAVTTSAIHRLSADGHELAICAQVMIEFWSVATRPKVANGIGVSAGYAAQFLDRTTRVISVLTEPPDMAGRWRRVVDAYGVISKQAHDARLTAFLAAHGCES